MNARDACVEVIETMLDLMHEDETPVAQRIEAGRLVHEMCLRSHALWSPTEFPAGTVEAAGGSPLAHLAPGVQKPGEEDQALNGLSQRPRQAQAASPLKGGRAGA